MSLCEARQEWDGCIRLCANYIGLFRGNDRSSELIAIKEEMEAKKNLAMLTRKIETQGSDYGTAKAILLDHLKSSPSAAERDMIRAQIERMDEAIKEQEVWETTVRFCRDEENPVTGGSVSYSTISTDIPWVDLSVKPRQ